MRTTETTKHAPAHWLGYGACALAGSLWGTGFFFGRLALNEMSVEYMVLYRFLFALLGMLPVLLRNRVRFSAEDLRFLLISATLGVPVQFLLQFHGLARTTVSHASLMVGSMPVLLAVGASIFAGERLDWTGWVALAGSTVGAGLVVLGGTHGGGRSEPTLAGDLLVVASLTLAVGWILLSKKLMARHSPPVVTAYTILAGTVMLAVWILTPVLVKPWIPNASAPMPFAHVSATAWIALAAGGLACTATTTLLWNWGIHHVPASRAGVFLNIEPALGSILGVELLGEHLGPYAWLGGALILGAAVTMTIRGHDPEVVLE
ncbi:DMT family transporter [Terracidiphilus sp.]|jgi:drug/metabolite transporter (DMT)-like permease|uniref:DMT family transporter n=1 Tax=Terracidiphilus sp. TaxID=1964191 RepID=UPI003C140B5D